MNVQNTNMNPMLNIKQEQVDEAAKQVKAQVANKVAIQSSNLNLVDPEMAAQLQSQAAPMAYNASGGVKAMPSNPMVNLKA